MHELQAGGCPRVLDALTFPARPHVASQRDAAGLCSLSLSVFSHTKADASAWHSVSVLALLVIPHVVAAPNYFSPAASSSSYGAVAICPAEDAEAGLLFFWQNNNLCLGQL